MRHPLYLVIDPFWTFAKIMRFAAIALALLPALAAAMPSRAEVPNSIAVLLGPSVGYLLAQSDLCGWGLTAKIEETYRDSFKRIGMTAEQQASAWSQAAARHKALTALAARANARMKAETCTPASRAQLEKDLGD